MCMARLTCTQNAHFTVCWSLYGCVDDSGGGAFTSSRHLFYLFTIIWKWFDSYAQNTKLIGLILVMHSYKTSIYVSDRQKEQYMLNHTKRFLVLAVLQFVIVSIFLRSFFIIVCFVAFSALTDLIIRYIQYFIFYSCSEFNIFTLQDRLNEGIINAFVTIYSGSG